MAKLTAAELTNKLPCSPFGRGHPRADAPIAPDEETLISVTLEQLQPYDLNPRVVRNPRFDELKASIRERGLDSPPTITRRPGADHYLIRNGGNTRLAILRELWSETQDPRFFRLACLFRPWPQRGEIVALTGHLAENELHGSLTFIERALGIDRARQLYEMESHGRLTQTELGRRLTADGCPVSQPHLSRMQEAVTYLLPAIPTLLYGGLGRPQVERLTTLRKQAERAWRHFGGHADTWPTLFHRVLSSFDDSGDSFSLQRCQDELVGQMAEALSVDYDSLALALTDTERCHRPPSAATQLPPPHRPEPAPATMRMPADVDQAPVTARALPRQWQQQLGQLATELAADAGLDTQVRRSDEGLGFACDHQPLTEVQSPKARALLGLLQTLDKPEYLSDRDLLNLMRLLRLTQRLRQQESVEGRDA